MRRCGDTDARFVSEGDVAKNMCTRGLIFMRPFQDNENIREKKMKKWRELAQLLVDDNGCVSRDGRDENG
jgi:hypothetical protein